MAQITTKYPIPELGNRGKSETHWEKPHTPESMPDVNIIDIRGDSEELDLKGEILALLKPDHGPKKLPTLLLYDEKGLQLFEKITYLDEYFLTNAEIDVLTRSAAEIALHISPGTMLVELGSGNLRKVSILLHALEAAGKSIDYYALDLSIKELERTLLDVPRFQHVRCHGLHGTYDDGLAWLKTGRNASRPKCILSLGSSIGNFGRDDAAAFLGGFAAILGPSDSMIIGLDACYDAEKVYHAYNDKEGITHKFILNGLEHANKVLGTRAFNVEDWAVHGEFVKNDKGGQHQAFYVPRKDVTVCNVFIEAGEKIQIEQSLKYNHEESSELWRRAGLKEVGAWSALKEPYNLHLLTKQAMLFAHSPQHYAATTIPSLADWRSLWATWDTVTRGMIPEEELGNKPIKLRNACIFYLGHIPTFLDMNLVKVTDDALCEPTYFPAIFERGIDPDVDDPEQCHAHSEIPDEWPQLDEILAHQARVRSKVEKLYELEEMSRELGRSLWLGFEHEIMHLETLLYMLLQSDKTLAPPRTKKPDFEKYAEEDEEAAVSNEWFLVPQRKVRIGLEDPEDNSGPDRPFGWDNEKPARMMDVPAFQAAGRAITNEDYAKYLEVTGKQIPASWVETASNHSSNATTNVHVYSTSDVKPSRSYCSTKTVRTVYGLVPLKYALHWPVFASYDELAGCAKWMGGRIPTFEEARSIYSHVDGLKKKEADGHLGNDGVNDHLVNKGVEESPPSRAPVSGEDSKLELFADLAGANVGFVNWHPTAITAHGNRLAGQGEMGGVWEWTSSPLSKHEGFEPMPLYPAYTADFFDNKHNIVLGGSWATHPRIAGRKTFVNWYQRNYPYAWCGARLVRDL